MYMYEIVITSLEVIVETQATRMLLQTEPTQSEPGANFTDLLSREFCSAIIFTEAL